MNISLALAAFTMFQAPPEQQALGRIRNAVESRSVASVRALFARPADADKLLTMTGRRDGLAALGVKVIPTPPGWEKYGDYWVLFHMRQGIQSFHDMAFELARTPNGYVIGREVPETSPSPYRIERGSFDVRLEPQAHAASVTARLKLRCDDGARSAIFRLNDPFLVSAAWADSKPVNVVVADDATVPRPRPGDALRAGGFLIAWDVGRISELSVSYRGVVNAPSGDKINENVCYLTSWWTPSIGRRPHTTSTRIQAPKDWVVVSEGVECSEFDAGFTTPLSTPESDRVRSFKCDVPISFPKVVGGRYKLAGELQAGRLLFRSYQLDPVEPERAKRDLELMKTAAEFLEGSFGPFPFPGYACFDADTYYGIESYSYTLLNRRMTTRFVTHEMTHTYFGGLVPNSYTTDTWNEGVTQYVDSVLFGKNRDGTLQNALRDIDLKTPLSRMDIAHAEGSASYWRGAYVMRMLESEIGLDKVLAGLRFMVADRRGADTTWPALRPYFEKASGRELGWFWDQWIEGATFPTIEIAEARLIARENEWTTWVTVRQGGTPNPFRLRLRIKLSGTRGEAASSEVILDRTQQTFRIDSKGAMPAIASLDVFEFALARTGPVVEVVR